MSLPFVLGTILSVAAAAGPEVLDSGLKPEDVERRPYREYVRECVELRIEHGTDRYGKVHSPLLMNILDVRTRDCPQDPLVLDEPWRVVRRGRRGPAGGDVYADQSALRAMIALGHVTQDNRYVEFAEKCMDYFMRNLVDERGLFWWGWHRHYDAYRDERTGHYGNSHEIHVQQAIWPHLWKVNRAAVTREIEAVWQWHGYDEKAGRFWGSLKLDGTPHPGPRVVEGYAQYEPRGYIDLWQPYVGGYEMPIVTAQCYAWASLITRDQELLKTADRWDVPGTMESCPTRSNPE